MHNRIDDGGDIPDAKQKPKKRSLLILEWLQCYAVYVAVISKKTA